MDYIEQWAQNTVLELWDIYSKQLQASPRKWALTLPLNRMDVCQVGFDIYLHTDIRGIARHRVIVPTNIAHLC
jgi:hypothetical protein